MAASSTYPVNGPPLIRGDPIDIPLIIRVAGTAVDITGWTWRAQIRNTPDGDIVATFDVTPGDATGELLLHLDDTDSALLEGGEVFDLEQLTPVHRTWWIVGGLYVRKDVSRDD
jgi:hypothetical protein